MEVTYNGYNYIFPQQWPRDAVPGALSLLTNNGIITNAVHDELVKITWQKNGYVENIYHKDMPDEERCTWEQLRMYLHKLKEDNTKFTLTFEDKGKGKKRKGDFSPINDARKRQRPTSVRTLNAALTLQQVNTTQGPNGQVGTNCINTANHLMEDTSANYFAHHSTSAILQMSSEERSTSPDDNYLESTMMSRPRGDSITLLGTNVNRRGSFDTDTNYSMMLDSQGDSFNLDDKEEIDDEETTEEEPAKEEPAKTETEDAKTEEPAKTEEIDDDDYVFDERRNSFHEVAGDNNSDNVENSNHGNTVVGDDEEEENEENNKFWVPVKIWAHDGPRDARGLRPPRITHLIHPPDVPVRIRWQQDKSDEFVGILTCEGIKEPDKGFEIMGPHTTFGAFAVAAKCYIFNQIGEKPENFRDKYASKKKTEIRFVDEGVVNKLREDGKLNWHNSNPPGMLRKPVCNGWDRCEVYVDCDYLGNQFQIRGKRIVGYINDATGDCESLPVHQKVGRGKKKHKISEAV